MDDRSGISEIKYRFRDEEEWQILNGSTLTRDVQPDGIPSDAQEANNEIGLPSGNGRYLIQALSKDTSGNSEGMPTMLYVVIDPSLNRAQCVDTTISAGDAP